MEYLQTAYELRFWGSVFWIFWIMWFFPRKYKYRCIRIYDWFKNDKHVIWMWIWLILKNNSLLDRIWSFSLTHQQTSYSGSAGWYFRYQPIHIQITYTSVSWKLNILFIMFKIIAFFIITLSVRLYTRVGILLTCGKQLHDHIITVRGEG